MKAQCYQTTGREAGQQALAITHQVLDDLQSPTNETREF
jgi:hypothetical protein